MSDSGWGGGILVPPWRMRGASTGRLAGPRRSPPMLGKRRGGRQQRHSRRAGLPQAAAAVFGFGASSTPCTPRHSRDSEKHFIPHRAFAMESDGSGSLGRDTEHSSFRRFIPAWAAARPPMTFNSWQAGFAVIPNPVEDKDDAGAPRTGDSDYARAPPRSVRSRPGGYGLGPTGKRSS